MDFSKVNDGSECFKHMEFRSSGRYTIATEREGLTQNTVLLYFLAIYAHQSCHVYKISFISKEINYLIYSSKNCNPSIHII